jgi:hypothetical protein
MTQVDEYEYAKSIMPQSLFKDTPYTEINYNYVNDINNGGNYTNSSLSLIQYDLTSIYNSSSMTDTRDHFLIIPTIRTAALSNLAAGVVAPNTSAFALTSLKNGNSCIIHQADLILDGGKTVTQLTPYSGIMYGINELSKMSKDDLTLTGKLKGYSSQLDNPASTIYSSGAYQSPSIVTSTNEFYPSTPGISNNWVWGAGTINQALAIGTNNQSHSGPQNSFTVNGNLQEKLSWSPFVGGQTTVNGWSNIFGVGTAAGGGNLNCIMPTANLNQDLTPYCTVINNVVVWYDFLCIRLSDIFGSMENIGLTRYFNGILRLYINTGVVSVQAITQNVNYKQLQFNGQQYSTFTNVCPLMINSLGLATNYSANAFTDITCGFFIGSTPNYGVNTFGGSTINFNNIPSSTVTQTRYYYSTILLDPLKASDYLMTQQNKTVISKEFLYNTYTQIKAGANYSQLVQSGVKNIKAVVIIPLISSSSQVGFAQQYTFSQYSSPFDPAGGGACSSPISLINLQVAIGGVNQLRTTYSYTFQSWIQELSKYNKSSTSEYGVESSLLDFNFWNMNKIYMVNVRSTKDDFQTPRNVVVSFINNSNVDCDVLIYTIYEQEMVYNVSTGALVIK